MKTYEEILRYITKKTASRYMSGSHDYKPYDEISFISFVYEVEEDDILLHIRNNIDKEVDRLIRGR